MLRTTDIQDKLLHLVGWEQNYDTSEISIAESLTQSESGLYFQQIHPLLTLENLNNVAPDFNNIEYPLYISKKGYLKGNVVRYDGLNYKALQNSKGRQPNIETDFWELTNPFSEWLEKKTKASIQKAISRFSVEKTVTGTTKNLCENRMLFDGTGRITDTIPNRKNLVGFEIVPIRAKGVTTKINKIGLQFTKPGKYTLYLMHSSMQEPVKVINLEKVKKGSIEWFSLKDTYLPYQSENNDAGGSWYLCYFQSELPEGSEAISKNRDWSKGPCESCSRVEYASWLSWSKYLEIHPFMVDETIVREEPLIEATDLWDISKNIYTYDTNYGINLEVSVSCDLTDFIIEQRSIFQDIIAKQVAIDMLKEFAYNPNVRTNRHTINASKLDIMYEIDGDSSSLKKSGLSYQLDLAFKALEVSTQGLDRICLPCKNHGIKYRTV